MRIPTALLLAIWPAFASALTVDFESAPAGPGCSVQHGTTLATQGFVFSNAVGSNRLLGCDGSDPQVGSNGSHALIDDSGLLAAPLHRLVDRGLDAGVLELLGLAQVLVEATGGLGPEQGLAVDAGLGRERARELLDELGSIDGVKLEGVPQDRVVVACHGGFSFVPGDRRGISARQRKSRPA